MNINCHNKSDIFLLVISIMLHDLGMNLTLKAFKALLSDHSDSKEYSNIINQVDTNSNFTWKNLCEKYLNDNYTKYQKIFWLFKCIKRH